MDWIRDFLKPEFIWAMIGLSLLLMEFAAPGLIIFFFGVGAWVVAAVCFFVDVSINLQIIIFLVSSMVFLAVLRKWLKGIFVGHSDSKQDACEGLSEHRGQKVIVQEKIIPPKSGRVELHGVKWNAQASIVIEAGQMVEVIGQESLTLIVKPFNTQGEDK